jgi:hypothetical protein
MKHIQNNDRAPRGWFLVTALLLAALAGAAVMVVELGVARILTPVFGGSISVCAIVIATTMLALAAGYAFGGYRAERTGGVILACRAGATGALLCASARAPDRAYHRSRHAHGLSAPLEPLVQRTAQILRNRLRGFMPVDVLMR